MANEVLFSFRPFITAYFLVWNKIGQIWNGSAFVTYSSTDYALYSATSANQQGTASPFYEGTFPATIPAGIYSITAKQQLGGSPAETDPTVALGDFQWSGTVVIPLSDLATSGQLGQLGPIRIARGVMIQNFPIYMKSATDHVTPLTSGVVSGQIGRDGGALGPLQSGLITEQGLGWYNVQALTSGDLNGDTIRLLFTGTFISGGVSDPLPMTIITQKVSGQ